MQRNYVLSAYLSIAQVGPNLGPNWMNFMYLSKGRIDANSHLSHRQSLGRVDIVFFAPLVLFHLDRGVDNCIWSIITLGYCCRIDSCNLFDFFHLRCRRNTSPNSLASCKLRLAMISWPKTPSQILSTTTESC